MKLTNKINAVFFFIGMTVMSQHKVCTSDTDDLEDLNSIGKCAIEKFKKSNTKEFIQVSSRSRYVRKKTNVHLNNFKKNVKSVSNYTSSQKKVSVVAKGEEINTTKATKGESSGKEIFIKNYLRFDQVTIAPVFVTCHNISDDVKEECNKETISGIILENITYPFDAAAEGISGKVWVRFVIDKEGYVTNITTKGPEKGVLLEQEAERLVKLLPKFMPGKHHGKYVNVEYFMPIEFHLDEE